VPEATEYAVSEASTAFGTAATGSVGQLGPEGVSWDLPQLGVGSMQADTPVDTALSVSSRLDETGTTIVEVTNSTGFEIEHWGFVSGTGIVVSPTSLAAGATATLPDRRAVNTWPGASFGEIVVDEKQLWNDEVGWQVVSPLGYATQTALPTESYVFGVAIDTDIPVVVNGSQRSVPGPTVWATPLDRSTGANNTTSGSLVSVGDWRNIEVGQGNFWLDTSHIVVSFDRPDGASSPTLERTLNGPGIGEVAAWNWQTGQFEPTTIGDSLDPTAFVSGAGELLVKVASIPQTGESPYPQSVLAEWSSGS
jgi:hypothetical protein